MDNQNQQRERRKGAVDYINSLRSVNLTLRTVGQIVTKPFPWVWIVVIIILLIVIFQLFFGGGTGLSFDLDDSQSPNLPGGGIPISSGGCPDTSTNTDPATCHYLNPAIDIFNTNISQNAIDDYINKYSPTFINAGVGDINEFRRRVNYIRNKAVFVGLNPAIFLGYWKTESLFSTYPGARDLGCVGSTFEAQVDCAVGLSPGGFIGAKCAVSRDANNQNCGGNLISTFDDFAERYGPIVSDPNNCSHTYNMLIDTIKELGMCTVPAPPSNIRQGLIDSFGITMDGFEEQHLRWAWEKFHETSNTRFPSLVRGITIEASGRGSSQIGCARDPVAVRLREYTSGDFFKFMLTHELGHVIQSCLPRTQSRFTDASNAYNIEGGISFYANNASSCNGTVNVNENYADIIAYYLNPNAGLASGPMNCGGPANPPNPFFSGQTRFPLHFSVGDAVLKEGI